MEASPAAEGSAVFAGARSGAVYALNAADGNLLWSYHITGDLRMSLTSADGLVYAGSTDTSLYALDAQTGKLAWSYKTNGRLLWRRPTVAAGVVYVGSDDDHLYAVDARTGQALWQRAFTAPVNSSATLAP